VTGPEVVYIDKRVARQMDQEGGGDLLGYVRQDVHEKAVRSAGTRERETIFQIITNPDGRLVGLSTWGRVWAFVSETKEDLPAWVLIAEELPAQELDS
jgi:hypothetical protein